MFRTLRKTLAVALAVLCVTSAVALAADGTLSGTVQNVDPQQGRITVRAGADNVVELRAPDAGAAPDRLQPPLVPISGTVTASWQPYVKNYAPNFTFDYVGRAAALGLDR